VKNVNKFPLLTLSSFPLRLDFSGLLLALLVVARPPRAGFGEREGDALRGWFVDLSNGSRFAIDGLEGLPRSGGLVSCDTGGDDDIRLINPSFDLALDFAAGFSPSWSDDVGEEEGTTLRLCLFAGGAMPARVNRDHNTSAGKQKSRWSPGYSTAIVDCLCVVVVDT
jgi:hypothetical protein